MFLVFYQIFIGNRLKLHIACFLHKILETGYPVYLRKKLIFRTSTHSRDTRYNDQLNIPRHSTALFQRSFSYIGPKLYNTLNTNLKFACSYWTFKNKLKKYLFDQTRIYYIMAHARSGRYCFF